jgi:hypothetical protein
MTQAAAIEKATDGKLLAFLIVVDGFGDMVASAATAAKARYVAWRAAQEAGYSSVTFARIRSRRWPDLDTWAAKQDKPAAASARSGSTATTREPCSSTSAARRCLST